MCGIAGQLALTENSRIDEAELTTMLRAMTHRGPDDEGIYLDRNYRIGLGMRRLAIIDLAAGHQPVFNEDRSVVCVFNGEIYNFQQLRADLEKKGHAFRSATDTEVIVHLYEEEGADCVNRLRGMFAFAIWDARNEVLMLARDRVGKKPLYYAEINGRLAFASEIGALYGLRGLRREVDAVALDLYLTYSYIPSPYSIYLQIRKLPPAHRLIVHHGRMDLSRYWRLALSPPWEASKAEITTALQAKLVEAVRLRMMSDVPLGCFLSGGTDSSAVVALMSKITDKPVKTFSIGFTTEQYNELPYARVVASRFKTEHHEFTVEPNALEVLPELVKHFGEPYGDSSALPTWYLSKLARQHVTVALNGDGGDELFGGYPWYRSGLRLDRMAERIPSWASSTLSEIPWKWAERVSRLGRRLGMEPGERFATLRRFLTPEMRRALYVPTLLEACGGASRDYLVSHYRAGNGADPLAHMQYVDIMTYLPEDLLVKVDRMTMAHSLEGRSPLLDHELLEFCVRIPNELKIGPDGGKMIFREVMAEHFPPGFLNRSKMGFSIPVSEWLRSELKDVCLQRVCRGPLIELDWFDRDGLRGMVDQHLSGARDWGVQLWNLLMLALWVEVYGVSGSRVEGR